MYKKSIATIAVILTTAAMLISLSGALAEHAKPDLKITPKRVDNDTDKVFNVTVTNTSGDKIDTVEVYSLPGGFSNVRQGLRIPAGENIYDNIAPENEVVLEAGTVVGMGENVNIRIAENTVVIRKKDARIFWEAGSSPDWDNLILDENAKVKLDSADITTNAKENGLTTGENVKLKEPSTRKVTLGDNVLAVISETTVINVSQDINQVELPDNTDVKILNDVLVNASDNGLKAGDNVTVKKDTTVAVDNGSAILTEDADAHYPGGPSGFYVPKGENVRLSWWPYDNTGTDNEVILEADQEVTLDDNVKVKVYEDTEAIKQSDQDVIAPAAENQPKGWNFDNTNNRWTTKDTDNMIAEGESENFLFAAHTSGSTGDKFFTMRTVDNVEDINYDRKTDVKVVVDGAKPYIKKIDLPDVAAHENVDITVTANENLKRLDNVFVEEDNSGENIAVSMSMVGDNPKKWSGTYETSDNWKRDGDAIVRVRGSDFEDLVGHDGVDNSNTFTIDRLKPPKPEVRMTPTNFAAENTKVEDQAIENIAYDNVEEGAAKVTKEQADMTVKVSVDDKVTTVTSRSDNEFKASITLAEGPNTIKTWFVDDAGNKGPENTQEIFLDTRYPKFSEFTPENGAWVSDRTPKISVKLVDPGMAENTGLGISKVDLRTVSKTLHLTVDNWSEDDPYLEFTVPDAENFNDGENVTVLVDNARDRAADYLESTTEWWFKVDVTTPSGADLADATDLKDIETGLKLAKYTETKKNKVKVSGTAREKRSKVLIKLEDGTVVGEASRDDVGMDKDFTITTDKLSEGTNKLYIQEIDRAGNESDKVLLGTVVVDRTAPDISLTKPESGKKTGKSSVLVKGTVTDGVSAYDEITVKIDATALAGTKDITLAEDGSFEKAVPLKQGATNTITVSATDEVGNPTSKTRTVERTAPVTWGVYAAIAAIIAIILAAIAVLRRR